MLCFGNGTRWAMNTCRCNFFLQNLSDRAAKAEGASKTLRDDMKKQHKLCCLKLQKTAILFKKVNLGERECK